MKIEFWSDQTIKLFLQRNREKLEEKDHKRSKSHHRDQTDFPGVQKKAARFAAGLLESILYLL